MSNFRTVFVVIVFLVLIAGTVTSVVAKAEAASGQAAATEQALWNLEHSYWRYVENNDLTGYLTLWHQDFLGWPSVSPSPVGKDHITDWITSQTAKGLVFKSIDFKPAKTKVTGDLAVACYWITYQWLDKDGKGAPRTVRITHTWIKDGKDWRIIGGMSMPEPAP